MITRKASYRDYGLFEWEKEVLNEYCLNLDDEKEKIIRGQIRGVNPSLENELYNSIVHNQSYDEQADRDYIPIGKKDFYGYRRRAMFEIYSLIMLLGLGK